MDNKNRVVVFHRATRVWDRTTFTEDNRYWNSNELAIDLPTIAIFNSTTGVLVEHWGQNMYVYNIYYFQNVALACSHTTCISLSAKLRL